jgi:hypothetical protein
MPVSVGRPAEGWSSDACRFHIGTEDFAARGVLGLSLFFKCATSAEVGLLCGVTLLDVVLCGR